MLLNPNRDAIFRRIAMHIQLKEVPYMDSLGIVTKKVKNGFFTTATPETKRIKSNITISSKEISWNVVIINKPRKCLIFSGIWSGQTQDPLPLLNTTDERALASHL
ncbi:hypothetical protein AAZV13_04G156000 [Glycine max]